MKSRHLSLVAATLALALVAAACNNGDAESTGDDEAAAAEAAAPEAPLPEGDCEADTEDAVAAARALMDEQVFEGSANFERATDVCGIEQIEVEVLGPEEGEGDMSSDANLSRASFAPTVLIGDPGQELTVRVANRDVILHTFTIEEQGIEEVLQPAAEPGGKGDPVDVKVTFPSDGEPVLFHCRFHKIGAKWGALVTY